MIIVIIIIIIKVNIPKYFIRSVLHISFVCVWYLRYLVGLVRELSIVLIAI